MPRRLNWRRRIILRGRSGLHRCAALAGRDRLDRDRLVERVWVVVANGGDDRAWVAAEIVAKNGMCDPLSQWSLTIDGDT